MICCRAAHRDRSWRPSARSAALVSPLRWTKERSARMESVKLKKSVAPSAALRSAADEEDDEGQRASNPRQNRSPAELRRRRVRRHASSVSSSLDRQRHRAAAPLQLCDRQWVRQDLRRGSVHVHDRLTVRSLRRGSCCAPRTARGRDRAAPERQPGLGPEAGRQDGRERELRRRPAAAAAAGEGAPVRVRHLHRASGRGLRQTVRGLRRGEQQRPELRGPAQPAPGLAQRRHDPGYRRFCARGPGHVRQLLGRAGAGLSGNGRSRGESRRWLGLRSGAVRSAARRGGPAPGARGEAPADPERLSL